MEMQAATAPQSPVAPPTAGRPVVVVRDAPGAGTFSIATPMSARELNALKAQRSELSDQLQSVDGRRSKLLSQLRSTGDPTAVKGLEDRLALLDKRQLQLESDLATTGQQLSSVPAGLVASTGGPMMSAGLGSGQVVAISIVSIIFVLGPLAVGFARMLFRQARRPALPPQAFTETAQRLERLEGAVDSIAIEIERISEGQRFVTKLLSEGQHAPAIGPGQRSPDSVRSSQ
ncbi:MAG: hypothetical protein QOH22_1991 [Gemmatimonadaceae bacterium]|nr:hypothetical protein [Gemmatimonadaceae bacterium]MEA2765982.1 hypothetical protein [Gemmatimonadaceae bacterium]